MKREKPNMRAVIATNIAVVLKAMKWEYKDWGKKAKVSDRSIRYYAGQTKSPSADTLAKLADPIGLEGWELSMPGLTVEMVKSRELARMRENYTQASPETKAYIQHALELDLARPKAG